MRPMTPEHEWRMCACERAMPAHVDAAPDPAGGLGCGMAWRPSAAGSKEIEERHITEVQPGGHLRQDASAGLVLPNHQDGSEEKSMVEATMPTERVTARTARRVVRELMRFELVDETTLPAGCAPVTVRGLLRWTSTDPHTVALVFRPGTPAEVTWLVGRDLLAAGVRGPAGLGDVSVLPDLRSGTHRELVLSSPQGRRGFRFPVAPVVAFLDRTDMAGGA
jgi:Streptomyces sporulation and cell division protein, SsgA